MASSHDSELTNADDNCRKKAPCRKIVKKLYEHRYLLRHM
jgi:hypothetical protein